MQKTVIVLAILSVMIIFVCIADGVIKNYWDSSFPEACLSLTFDDGLKSHYSVVPALLKEKNFNATFFVLTDPYKKSGNGWMYMTLPEMKSLVKDGYEIGSHTLSHPDMKSLLTGQLIEELMESKQILEQDLNTEVSSFAFPFSRYSKEALDLSKQYYRVIRSLYPKSFFIQTYALRKTTDYKDVCELIAQAKKRSLWLILVFHEITDSPKKWDTSIRDFKNILECGEKSNIKINSLYGCKKTLAG